jgi:hypothetical protein
MFQPTGPIGLFAINKESVPLMSLSNVVAHSISSSLDIFGLFRFDYLSFVCFSSDWEHVESDCRRALELDRHSLKVELRNRDLL